MIDPVARRTDKPPEDPPRSRLEGWLARVIQGGALRSLPRYAPLRGRGSQCPEQYARTLLTGLRSCGDRTTLERLKDDGRAFRSWAEPALLHIPQRGGVLGWGAFAS